MKNKLFSKKIIIPAFILFSGVLIAAGIFLFLNLKGSISVFALQSPKWSENIGQGILFPACGSSSASVTCSDGLPSVSFNWTTNGPAPDGTECNTAGISISGQRFIGGLSCSGNYTWTGGSSNRNYSYDISFETGRRNVCVRYLNVCEVGIASDDCGLLTGICGEYGTEVFSYNHPISNGDFSTPVCGPPGDFTLSLGGSGTAACNSVPLSWTASPNATAYRILKGSPRVDISPYQPYTALNFNDTSATQNTSYIYQIEAYNSAGTKRSNALNVTTPYCPPVLNFFGNPTTIDDGQSSELRWSSSYASSCTASGAWSGSKAVDGRETVFPAPPPSVTYNMQCSGLGGTTPLQSVIIRIIGLPGWREIIPR